jgi:flagellar basal body-associated protein FliL
VAIGIYLRSLLAPDRRRWRQMLMGLALFAAGVGAAVNLQPPAPLAAALIVLALAAWVTGACAMVGYVRWFIASEIAQAKKDNE